MLALIKHMFGPKHRPPSEIQVAVQELRATTRIAETLIETVLAEDPQSSKRSRRLRQDADAAERELSA